MTKSESKLIDHLIAENDTLQISLVQALEEIEEMQAEIAELQKLKAQSVNNPRNT